MYQGGGFDVGEVTPELACCLLVAQGGGKDGKNGDHGHSEIRSWMLRRLLMPAVVHGSSGEMCKPRIASEGVNATSTKSLGRTLETDSKCRNR